MKITLEKSGSISIYVQLYRQIKQAIIAGELLPGYKLPSVRVLANDLNINPATVVKAYSLLEKEQLIFRKVGSGSFVASQTFQSNKKLAEFNSRVDIDNESFNFASAIPTTEFFPVESFQKVLNEVIQRDQGAAFGYQDSQGYRSLRESVCQYLGENGIEAQAQNIQITSGAQQGIDLLAKALVGYNDSVFVEDPTYPGAISVFKSRQANLHSFPVQDDGMDLNELEADLINHNPRLLYIMVNFQNPTGVCWSVEKKKRLLELAQKYDFYIVEDDCLSDLYYGPEKPSTLKSLDRYGRVIYMKSFSKVSMPGLRLAFMVLPVNLINRILIAKHATDISSSGLIQRAFDLYLRQGLWDKHITEIRRVCAERFHIMHEAIKKLPSQYKLVVSPSGGLYFWLKLPDGLNSEELYARAIDVGVSILPGRYFSLSNGFSFIRISFAATNKAQILEGMKRFSAVCNTFVIKAQNSQDRKLRPIL